MIQLLVIFIALLAGYACKRLPFHDVRLNQMLEISIVVLLLLMGYTFGVQADVLMQALAVMSKTILTFVALLLLCNVLAVGLYFHYFVQSIPMNAVAKVVQGNKIYALMTLKYIFYFFLGVVLGYLLQVTSAAYMALSINAALLLMLFIVGHQLRQQGVLLHEILLNKYGMIISVLIVLSSLLAGLLSATLLHLSDSVSFVLVSGFGWYTLSGVLTSQVVNSYFGAIAFFIDFFREISALMIISLIGRLSAPAAIGYGGATSLDCCLPLIKSNFGTRAVPIAVTCGAVLTLLTPILIPLFAHYIKPG